MNDDEDYHPSGSEEGSVGGGATDNEEDGVMDEDEVSDEEGVMDEDGVTDDANILLGYGEGGQRKLHDLLALIGGIIAVDGYETRNKQKEFLDERYHKPLLQAISSCLRTDAGFLDATAYSMYLSSMPEAMKQLQTEIEQLPAETKNELLTEMWWYASVVGDGNVGAQYPCVRDGNKQILKPREELAIKDASDGEIPVKEFLTHPNQRAHGFRLIKSKKFPNVSRGIRRPINLRLWEGTPAEICPFLLLSFKKWNWRVIRHFTRRTRMFVDNVSPYGNAQAEVAFKAQAIILSSLSTLHGSQLPSIWYREDFQKLLRHKYPFLFDIVFAGMIGTDGSVGVRGDEYVFRLYQSIRAYCEEFAEATRKRYDVDPKVSTTPSKTLKWKPQSTIRFSTADTEKLLLRVGSFDLNRAEQHIVLMLKVLVKNGNQHLKIKNVNKIKELLGNLASYIKRVRPS